MEIKEFARLILEDLSQIGQSNGKAQWGEDIILSYKEIREAIAKRIGNEELKRN